MTAGVVRLRPLNQETLLFDPAVPEAGALRAVLAFPSTYSVGITSLGYQVVWATLARRGDVDVRRLFTDQGDPPHGSQRAAARISISSACP